MTNSAVRLGKVFGFEIRLHVSWFIIFFLVVWSLAGNYFPATHPGWNGSTYWAIGTLTSLLFFASVLLHEMAHGLVARRFGVAIDNITLYFFGGVAQMDEEPPSPRAEFWIALVGPLTSLALAGGFGALWWLTSSARSGPLHALGAWLAWINLALALFNLVPGFPLDGGRVFRSIVWGITGNFRRATTIAAGVGRVVGMGFIFWGVWQIFGGNWMNGLWIAFIGWFLDNAATQNVAQIALEDALAGRTARDVMNTNSPRIAPFMTLDTLVHQEIFRTGQRAFLVVDDDRLYGLVTLHRITDVSREQWPFTRVDAVMIPQSHLKTVQPDDALTDVLKQMTAEDINQFPVVDDGHLFGMVTRESILTFIQLHSESGGQSVSRTNAASSVPDHAMHR